VQAQLNRLSFCIANLSINNMQCAADKSEAHIYLSP